MCGTLVLEESGVFLRNENRARLTVPELLQLYGAILHELAVRQIIRTVNSPTGDYAEYLVRAALNGELAPNSEKSWDVLTPEGRRVQVKCRIVASPLNRGQRQLSVIRSFDFHDLAIVLFNPDYSIMVGVVIPVEVAKSKSVYRPYVNGYVLFATDSLLHDPSAIDIGHKLRAVG